MKNIILALTVAVLAVTSAIADDFSLGGSGNTGLKNHNTSAAISASYGLQLDQHVQLRLTQGVGYSYNGGSSFTGSTLVGPRYLFNFTKRIQPFVGVDAGAVAYGNSSLTWGVEPNGGLRFAITKDVFADLSVGYQFTLSGRTIQNGDNLLYALKLGFSF